MADSPPPLFFQGMAVFKWSPNRLYRVYMVPGELILHEAASFTNAEAISRSEWIPILPLRFILQPVVTFSSVLDLLAPSNTRHQWRA